ncbi:hypothetical protein GCM10023311_12900 [Flaviramulus aquimarinus]|uniref:Alpha-L-glutamate ligase-related protein ATP-grasp domain-containing protein n=2 Tax=Flaviramulus aquimarinus TaxID=1170456 RepID=A0ABP9F7T2_9FLAO
MIKEVLILMVNKREIPYYYFKYLYRKEVTNYLDYLSLGEQRTMQFHKALHNPEYVTLINNKLYFHLLSEKTSIKTPKLLSYNFQSNFFYNNKIVQINSIEEFTRFFDNIFQNANIEGVFFRPPSDYGGKGCFKITKGHLNSQLDEAYETLKAGNFVHTELIRQHPLINQIHSSSINTLRIISLITSNDTIEIISAFIRFGIGNSVVDNASSGGFFVGINLNTGTLKPHGHFLPEYGGDKITEHPDSSFKFEGFTIPFYEDACESVINAVKIIPDRLIGWDVAITSDGPIIIETNAEPHMQMSNIAYGGLLKNKHVKELMQELKTM